MTYKTMIETFTEKAALTAGADQTVDVLVRISPPTIKTNGSGRPKLNIGIALDRSGSMGGPKMQQAREAAKYCIDQMTRTDRFSAVIFDDQVDVLFTGQPVENKEMLKRGIDRIRERNSTALHEGWVKAGIQVSEWIDPVAINRVLLITDGQANVGETRVDRIVEQSRELAAKGVSTSTIGIGADFNEDLLMPMAEAGQGNAWHVQEPEDMVRIFATEMQGLIAQIGRNVTLDIAPSAGVTVAEVLNDLEKDSSGRYILPNLMAGSPLDIVVRLRVPAHAAGESAELAEFDVSYISQETNRLETIGVSFAAGFVSADEAAALPANPEVAGAVGLLMNARARREAMAKMDVGDYDSAINDITFARSFGRALHARIPSPRLEEELGELEVLEESLKHRENDAMSRKRMAYQRDRIRKTK